MAQSQAVNRVAGYLPRLRTLGGVEACGNEGAAALAYYRLAPTRATRFSEVWLGALAATLLIWIGEWLFLLHGDHFTSFNALYGTLGGVCFCAALAKVGAKSAGSLKATSG